MLIRCWGARGSIPVSGKEYLKYGGDSPCLEIRNSNDDIIIVDAGSGIRRLGKLLLAEKRHRYHMLFTHAHWDHLLGFPFFRPIYFSKTSAELYGCPFAHGTVRSIISGTMQPPNFPVKYSDISMTVKYHTRCQLPFSIGAMHVTPILLSHPNQGLGYKFQEGDKTFVFLTDNELRYRHEGGLDFDDYAAFSQGADLLIHDAEYRQSEYDQHNRTWGHSTYNDAIDLALQANVRRLGLFHHNQERTDDQVDEIVEDAGRIIRAAGRALDCFAVTASSEITL